MSSFTVNVWQLIHNITFIVLKKIRITFIGVLVTNKNLNGLYIERILHGRAGINILSLSADADI